MYFINTYEVVIDDAMMGNVFNTRFSEASGFFSSGAVIYLLFLGILPSVYLFARKTDYGSFKRFSLNVGGSLGVILAVALINFSNWSWMQAAGCYFYRQHQVGLPARDRGVRTPGPFFALWI